MHDGVLRQSISVVLCKDAVSQEGGRNLADAAAAGWELRRAFSAIFGHSVDPGH